MRAFNLGGATCLLGLLGLLVACGPDSSAGKCSDSLIAGDLVITEVFADAKPPPGGSGVDEGKEWFEIYNASDRPIELGGLTITHSRPDGSRANSHVMGAVTIAPSQFFTLGNSADDLLPPYVDYGFSADLGDFFNSDGGQLRLACGVSEIDSAVYEGVKEGHARQLTASQPPDYTLNDDQLNWCEANGTEFQEANFGSPGAENDCSPVIIGQCTDGAGMRDTVPPSMAGDLVITEIMPRPDSVSATTGQWFEVLATRDVDLNGVGLERLSDMANPTVINSPDCLRLDAGGYGVFARSGDPLMNGNLTTLGVFPFSINPTGVPGDVQVQYGGVVIDAVTWMTSSTGRSLSLSPAALTSTANDDPSNFCPGSTVYNTEVATGDMDYGSPGAANPACGTMTAGMCMGTTGMRPIVKPAAGQLVITEFIANPDGTDTQQEWFEIKNTGTTDFDLNGLGLKGTAATVNVIVSGDCKPVTGGGYALFARNADTVMNGGLPIVDSVFTFGLGQTTGSPQTIQVLDGTTPLDTVIYTPGATTWPIPDGASKQLKTPNTNVTDNDLAANWCDGLAVYGTGANLGTPKVANTCP